jgi:pimeloyl-ACP methyl ester carboxylesterase
VGNTLNHRGCTLSYSVQGEGPPVLLIQGVGVCGSGWSPQVKDLARDYRCLSFDNRGMGASQPLESRLTIEQMAADALALMDTQGWASAHVVGHSIGGLVALEVALSNRERVRSLSLLCTFSRGADATKMTAAMMWTGLRTRIGTRRQRRRAFLEIVMPAEYLRTQYLDGLAERLAPIFGHDLADQPSIVMKQLGAARKYDATPRLHELAGLPTLVVTAAHDRIARPEYGRAIAAAIPGASYVEIPDAAHGVTIQRPEEINRTLREQFARESAAV